MCKKAPLRFFLTLRATSVPQNKEAMLSTKLSASPSFHAKEVAPGIARYQNIARHNSSTAIPPRQISPRLKTDPSRSEVLSSAPKLSNSALPFRKPGPQPSPPAANPSVKAWKWEDSDDALWAYGSFFTLLAAGLSPALQTNGLADLPYFVGLASLTIYIGDMMKCQLRHPRSRERGEGGRTGAVRLRNYAPAPVCVFQLVSAIKAGQER